MHSLSVSGQTPSVNQENQEHQERQEQHGIITEESRVLSPDTRSHQLLQAIIAAKQDFDDTVGIEQSHGDWKTPVFSLARRLRSTQWLGHLDAVDALDSVEWIMESSGLSWSDVDDDIRLDDEDNRMEFLDVWSKIRTLIGTDWLVNAIAKSEQCPLKLPGSIRRKTDGYSRFLAIAYWLQVDRDYENILLPVERLAEQMHVKPMTISRYRRWAQADGYLTLVREGERKRRADEFRCDLTKIVLASPASN
jgi:hypothetical protein